MSNRITDKIAVRRALEIAIDTEESLMDAYNYDATADAVKRAKKNIAAFRRVLDRYFGGQRKDPLQGGKFVNIFSLMKD